MVNLRDPRLLNRPPPIYKPPGVYLTVVIYHSGKFVTSPKTKYSGGSRLVLDYVVAKQISLVALKNQIADWLLMDPDSRVYIFINNDFKELSTDEEVREFCFDGLGIRQVTFYVGEKEMVIDKGKKHYAEIFGSEIVPAEQGVGYSKQDGRDARNEFEDEGNNSDDFTDSDYNMNEGSDVDDDMLFDEHVSREVENELLTDERSGITIHQNVVNELMADLSDIDEDVVNEVMADFDEYKDSDGEQENPSYPVFNPEVIFEPEFELGMLFSDRQQFKLAIQSHAVKTKRSLKITKTAPARMYVKCEDDNCEWKIHLTKIKDEDSYQISQYASTHTCDETFCVKNINSKWVGLKFMQKFVSNRKRKVEEFRLDAIDELKVDISKDQAYRAKNHAVKILEGEPAAQYSKLWQYADELRRTNPGSTVIVGLLDEEDGLSRFDKFYVCFDAVKKGFTAACRPLIGIDGCHLKGTHYGILLSAVGVDANNNIFPIAWAVVSKESRETWGWFLVVLKQDLGIFDDSAYTFMSDKQKGLIQAMAEVFPSAAHRFCVRHLHGNFKQAGFRGQSFKSALWRAAQASTISEWKGKMNELKKLNEAAWKWLEAKPAEQWSRSHFTELPKCDMLLNNVCEVFNSTILDARDMPIITMLDWIRQWLMARFQRHRDLASLKWKGRLCPRPKKILEKHAANVSDCIPIKGSNTHYQIKCNDGGQFVVDLDSWSCSCRMWGLSGIPCKHAICAITHQKKKREDFVHECYTVATFQKAYAGTIFGINGQSMWDDNFFIPPLPPKMVNGRGIGARKKEPDEVKLKKKTKLRRRQSTVKCSGCGSEGHNSATCGRHLVYNQTNLSAQQSQIPTPSEVCDEEFDPFLTTEIPTQGSQVPGPSMFNQLKQGQLILESQKKFISLADLQKRNK